MASRFDRRHGTRVYSYDSVVETMLRRGLKGTSPAQLGKGFALYVRRIWLKKFLAHYELFRNISRQPGDIIELGVFRGLSLFSFAHFNEAVSARRRTVYGIDNFHGFTKFMPEDGPRYDVPKHVGGFSPRLYLRQLKTQIRRFNKSARRTRIELVVGNVEDVIGRFRTRRQRFALAHFDVDLFLPTREGLRVIFPRLVREGVLVFDEYGIVEWSGETKAVDEYFYPRDVIIKKFPWQGAPGGYIIKK